MRTKLAGTDVGLCSTQTLRGRTSLLVLPGQRPVRRGRCRQALASAKPSAEEQSSQDKPEPGAGLKAVWYGAEQFGNLIGLAKPRAGKAKNQPQAGISRQDAIAAIRKDYDSNYFVSGQGDMVAYADDCLFADPFAGFNGVERFKKNVSNLGGLMEDIKLDITGWEEKETELETKWRFNALLSLPWRPRLAASGGTTHVFDQETGLVVKHIESWNVEPGAVVKSLLNPSTKKPTTNWEKVFKGLHDGDPAGTWLAASGPILRWYAFPVVAVSSVTKRLTGHGLPGTFLGTIEGFAYLLGLVAVVTQAYQLTQRKE
ncbi:g3454 [Coccomyxa viridis]|uniref:G3454 protein n=1 Tax=Coccomyxa viridis TaxID=1274662 RepID=A0ABP1FMU2_9CHLO